RIDRSSDQIAALIVFRSPGPVLAGMPVPEAAAHVDNLPEARKNKVWAPRQIPGVDPVTVPQAENELPDEHLWLCILRPDRRHVAASLFRGKPVSHEVGTFVGG